MQASLVIDLSAIRDHDIGLADRDLIKNRPVVEMLRERRVGEVRFGEALVGAARIEHNAHTGPVDRADRHADRAKKPLRTAIPTLTGADCLNAKSISLSANIGHGRRGRY